MGKRTNLTDTETTTETEAEYPDDFEDTRVMGQGK
jgi:hypothetical protein